MRLFGIVLLLISIVATAAPIGTITELTGTVVEIKRNKEKLVIKLKNLNQQQKKQNL